jgi:carnitine O-palmitoyltransferase 2
MQMAFQLAHHRMNGGLLPSTYESASTAAFKHGRTETIRSATPEAAAFVAAFADANASASDKASTMRAAVDNHTRVTREALMGKGMDRHLFALRTLAAASGRSPRLFESAAAAKLSKIILSTSTLASDIIVGGGFGPVNDECFALGYGIRSIGSETQIMTYGLDSRGFAECLSGAMDDMLRAGETSD